MRLTLDLDEHLVRTLTTRHPELSKTAAIEQAIRSYVEAGTASELRRLAGSVEIEDVSVQLRDLDRSP